MVRLSCTASRENGVTLVTGRVENPGDRRRVRLTSRLDGPLWPPRRQGVPARGWDDETFECVLAADEVRPLGVASPAPPADPPFVIEATEPVDTDDGIAPRVAVPAVDPTPESVVRTLGAPRPPRDAVATPDPDGDPVAGGEGGDPGGVEPGPDDGVGHGAIDRDAAAATTRGRTEVEEVQATLAAVAARIETADRLSTTERLPAATDALRDVGGVAGARDLDAQLSRDAARLARLASRASELADRAEAATVPTARLDRVR